MFMADRSEMKEVCFIDVLLEWAVVSKLKLVFLNNGKHMNMW